MPEPTKEQWREIQQHIFAGRAIQAIKLYREATGGGLKESKDAMDAYAERLRRERPEHFSVGAPKKGCAGMILLFCGIASALVATGELLD